MGRCGSRSRARLGLETSWSGSRVSEPGDSLVVLKSAVLSWNGLPGVVPVRPGRAPPLGWRMGAALSGREPPKLVARLRGALRSRHYSQRTEEVYVRWVRRYVRFH